LAGSGYSPLLFWVSVILLVIGFARRITDPATTESTPFSTGTLFGFAPAPEAQGPPYDKTKWAALVKYDEEIGAIAEKLKPLGQRWIDEFASSYLALNDKQYLGSIAKKVVADARSAVEKEKEEEKKREAWREKERRHVDERAQYNEEVRQQSKSTRIVGGIAAVTALAAVIGVYVYSRTQAVSVPLVSGQYVLTSVACEQASNATQMYFVGGIFSAGRMPNIRVKAGPDAQTFEGEYDDPGGGSLKQEFRIVNSNDYVMTNPLGSFEYRYCRSP
jgi:hypothetical protein